MFRKSAFVLSSALLAAGLIVGSAHAEEGQSTPQTQHSESGSRMMGSGSGMMGMMGMMKQMNDMMEHCNGMMQGSSQDPSGQGRKPDRSPEQKD